MVSAVVAFLVMSCGGVSVESNEVFGDVPGIYKAIGDNTKQEIENAKGADNPEDIGKAKEAAEKFEAEMLEKLPAAIAEIGGRDVPFSGERCRLQGGERQGGGAGRRRVNACVANQSFCSPRDAGG